jgi:hypothetical protein
LSLDSHAFSRGFTSVSIGFSITATDRLVDLGTGGRFDFAGTFCGALTFGLGTEFGGFAIFVGAATGSCGAFAFFADICTFGVGHAVIAVGFAITATDRIYLTSTSGRFRTTIPHRGTVPRNSLAEFTAFALRIRFADFGTSTFGTTEDSVTTGAHIATIGGHDAGTVLYNLTVVLAVFSGGFAGPFVINRHSRKQSFAVVGVSFSVTTTDRGFDGAIATGDDFADTCRRTSSYRFGAVVTAFAIFSCLATASCGTGSSAFDGDICCLSKTFVGVSLSITTTNRLVNLGTGFDCGAVTGFDTSSIDRADTEIAGLAFFVCNTFGANVFAGTGVFDTYSIFGSRAGVGVFFAITTADDAWFCFAAVGGAKCTNALTRGTSCFVAKLCATAITIASAFFRRADFFGATDRAVSTFAGVAIVAFGERVTGFVFLASVLATFGAGFVGTGDFAAFAGTVIAAVFGLEFVAFLVLLAVVIASTELGCTSQFTIVTCAGVATITGINRAAVRNAFAIFLTLARTTGSILTIDLAVFAGTDFATFIGGNRVAFFVSLAIFLTSLFSFAGTFGSNTDARAVSTTGVGVGFAIATTDRF